ncbi:MAG: hypothetical protein ACKO2K_02120, partial [Alphaproteobacteria bacterium]
MDGVETSVLRVNGFVRGVPVTAGRHRVELRYRPASVRVGACISLLSAALAALLLARSRSGRTS